MIRWYVVITLITIKTSMSQMGFRCYVEDLFGVPTKRNTATTTLGGAINTT